MDTVYVIVGVVATFVLAFFGLFLLDAFPAVEGSFAPLAPQLKRDFATFIDLAAGGLIVIFALIIARLGDVI